MDPNGRNSPPCQGEGRGFRIPSSAPKLDCSLNDSPTTSGVAEHRVLQPQLSRWSAQLNQKPLVGSQLEMVCPQSPGRLPANQQA